jgi:hypothetical protein
MQHLKFYLTPLAICGFVLADSRAGDEARRADIPQELKTLLSATHLSDSWQVDYTAKPLYLLGDFDGDGKRDYAVFLRRSAAARPTIAILFSTQGAHLASSEKEIGDIYPGPDWQIHPRSKSVRSRPDLNDEHGAPHLHGDAILLEKPESSSALLYWDKGHLRLYWFSD